MNKYGTNALRGICCPISWECSSSCKNSCLPDVSVHQFQPVVNIGEHWWTLVNIGEHWWTLVNTEQCQSQPTWSSSVKPLARIVQSVFSHKSQGSLQKVLETFIEAVLCVLYEFWLNYNHYNDVRDPLITLKAVFHRTGIKYWIWCSVYVSLVGSLLETDIYSCSVLILPDY